MVSQAKMLMKGENWVHGAKVEDDQVGQIKLCLMKKKLYHVDTGMCFPPLERGPCHEGEWLMLGSVPGNGNCKNQLKCKGWERPVLDLDRGAVCGCQEGEERVGGSCQTLYSQGVCCFFLMDFRLERRSVLAILLARGATNAQLSRLQKQNFLQKEPRQEKKELNF